MCYFAVSFLKRKLGYDDALDAFGIHAIGGVTGGVLTGLFCVPELSWTEFGGLFYTGDPALLGAQVLGERVADLAKWEIAQRDFLHVHATGSIEKADFAALAARLGIDHSPKFIIREYIDNMPEMLAAADLVISRAGALTLAEIAAVGRASVLIPSPNVAENHQYHNAMQLQKLGAAVVVEEKELTGEKLIGIVDKLTKDPAELMLMGAKARALAQPDSLDKICENLDRLMKTTA